MNADARVAEAQGPVPAVRGEHRESTPALPATRHVAHIDGLRAIAVLAVIAYHLDERWLPGGFAGVDVFFAISGFVVAASVHGWREGGLGAFLGYFYARRVQRIVPALLVCLVLTSVASALLIPAAWLSRANELTGLHAFFGLANWYLANQREAYFAPTSEFNPYTHTWSLGVEEQFYLLFPLLFFAWTRGIRWRVLSSCLVAITLVASLAIAMRLARTDPTGAFYLIQSRMWELASGVLLFQALSRGQGARARGVRSIDLLARSGAWLSLGMLAWGLATSNPRAFPWPGAWLPVLGTLGVIGFLHGREGGVLRAALGSAPMAAIGRLSYSLYLWHWPVFVLLRWTIGLDSISSRAIGLAATFALATASYLAVERPFRYSVTLRRWPRQAVVAAGILLACGAWAVTLQVFEHRRAFALTTVSRNSGDWYAVPAATLPDVPGCFLRLEPGTQAGGLQVMSRVGCAAPPHRAPTVFALGDSHATGYMTLLGEHVLRSGARVVLYHNPRAPSRACSRIAKAAPAPRRARRRSTTSSRARNPATSSCSPRCGSRVSATSSRRPMNPGMEQHDRSCGDRSATRRGARASLIARAARGERSAYRARSAQAALARAALSLFRCVQCVQSDLRTRFDDHARGDRPLSRAGAREFFPSCRAHARAQRLGSAARAVPGLDLRGHDAGKAAVFRRRPPERIRQPAAVALVHAPPRGDHRRRTGSPQGTLKDAAARALRARDSLDQNASMSPSARISRRARLSGLPGGFAWLAPTRRRCSAAASRAARPSSVSR